LIESQPNPSANTDREAEKPDLARIMRSGIIGVAFFNALLLAILIWPRMPHHARVATDNILQCLGPLAAFICSLLGSWRSQKGAGKSRQRQWASIFLALGTLGYAVGQIIWTYYELVLAKSTPFPSWADAGYLAAYPCMLVGILALPTRPIPVAARLRVLFDSLMLMVALVAFGWYFVLGPTLMQGGESMTAKIIGTAYPFCDLVLLSCAILLFLRVRDPQLRSLATLICSGLSVIIAIDTVFDFQTLHNTYQTGRWIDVGWPLGYMFIAVAARMTRLLESDLSQETTRGSTTLSGSSLRFGHILKRIAANAPTFLPYCVVPSVGALVWHAMATGGDENLETGVYSCAAILVVLLLARQFITVLENQQLAARQREFNENLEHAVAERTMLLSELADELRARTEQLASLQRLTVAVNETLVVEQVVSASILNLQQVFRAEAAILWLNPSQGTISYPSMVKQCGLKNDGDFVSQLTGMDNGNDLFECELPKELTVEIGPEADSSRKSFYLQASLRWQSQLLGKIGVIRTGWNYEQADHELLQSIALQVATALENARQFCAAREAADRDPITGLWNHRAINEYLAVALEVARDQEEPVTAILTDIDNFKLFNDTYGHPAGDVVLQRISQILIEECTVQDRVGRYGGDEFLIVLSPGKDIEEGLQIAERLRDRVLKETFQHSEFERTIPLGLSFGVAAFPLDSQDRHDLLRTADANLSIAKNSDEHVISLTEMQRSHRELRTNSSFRILDALVTAVDNKDHYTRRHSEDVTTYSLWIAEELGLSEEILATLRLGGLLHDVGKIGVPDEILRKPGKLTDEEYDTLKQHSALGALIVAGIPDMEAIVDIVRHHHERWDGRGYPDGLAGEGIPLLARITAVADAVSAMTTDRPYRKAMDWQVCIDEVRRCTGSQFETTCAEAFLRAVEKNLPELRKTGSKPLDLPKAA
jgi:diguanylate cyclase (GGDEF)-like protein/putative nucleotidyltransferase with HDIG domain